MNRTFLTLTTCFAAILGACDKTEPKESKSAANPEPLPQGLFVDAAPQSAVGVLEAAPEADVGETVTVTGKIGGSKTPFATERAMFTIVDASIPSCDQNPADSCPTPWDYCCEDRADVAAASATIRVSDAEGILKHGLDGEGGLNPGDIVTVVGTVAQAGEAGLVIDATSIFVGG